MNMNASLDDEARIRATPFAAIISERSEVKTSPSIQTRCQFYYPEIIEEPQLRSSSPSKKNKKTKEAAAALKRVKQEEYEAKKAAYDAEKDFRDRLGLQQNPDADPKPVVLFKSATGEGINNPIVVAFAQGCARTSPILCFTGTDNMDNKVSLFHSLRQRYPTATTHGGRSLGARSSCRASIYSPTKKLLLWSYPLVRDLDFRTEELLALPADVQVLFTMGTCDAMCPELLLAAVRKRMRAQSWCIRIEGGNHQFDFDHAEEICGIVGQIAGIWSSLRWNTAGGTELTVLWNEGENRVTWGRWQAPNDATANPQISFE